MSDERARRVGLNEALFREVNEEIGALTRSFADGQAFEIICECGDGECTERLSVNLSVYGKARANGNTFLIATGHDIPDLETVIERFGDYVMVEKHQGLPTRLAERTDPRT